MITLYKKEISIFFSSMIGPLYISLFLFINGLVFWANFSEFNILDNSYASMNIFFQISPIIFLVFIPALSMNTFSKEYSLGTIEILKTKPILEYQIILSKFFAIFSLIILSIIPTFIYVITIYMIGETLGNLDLAGIIGSYIGLILLSASIASISIYASSITKHQINAFIIALIFSVFFYFGFDVLSKITLFSNIDATIQKIGFLYHYESMSKGLLLVSDIVYFISIIFLFLKFSEIAIKQK